MQNNLSFRMRLFALICCCFQNNSSHADDVPEQRSLVGHSLVGQWKSNAELTLQSLNELENISESSLDYLKKNVLGRLTVEFTDTRTRSYFGDANDSSTKFSEYKILERSSAITKIEHTDPLNGEVIISTLHWENDCYYELVSKWQYKEYFCPAVEKKKFIAIPKSNLNQ